MHRGQPGRRPHRGPAFYSALRILAVALVTIVSAETAAQTSRAVDAMDGRRGSTPANRVTPTTTPRADTERNTTTEPRRRQARAEIRAGDDAMEAGNAEAAMRHFRRAYELSPDPRTLLSLSRAPTPPWARMRPGARASVGRSVL